ncbi:MarR family winged helix-turn-helix transcriptional regulator [Streptomyces sp. NPDC053048]|uniref:MarR family winged helix-turn-helix transcriptional regulator n=1 Tax=Streptomyces sp. NPDC053048 TaxID=3365694 RepID=UPI0037CD3012
MTTTTKTTTQPTTNPADPHTPTDFDSLAAQPIGYWSWVAHEAVIRHIRTAMAHVDITQPQWWILNHVHNAGEAGLRREQIGERLRPVVGIGSPEIGQAADSLLARGWLTADGDGLLHLTDAGREAKARTKEVVTRVRSEIHDGITDEEYVAALRVLRRMIDNTGGIDALIS